MKGNNNTTAEQPNTKKNEDPVRSDQQHYFGCCSLFKTLD